MPTNAPGLKVEYMTEEQRFTEYERLVAVREETDLRFARLRTKAIDTGDEDDIEEANNCAARASQARKAVTAFVRSLCALTGGAR
jgi:hypothetical protein